MPASAQAPYPSQIIKIIVPNPPGGLPDTISRIVGKQLHERMGQPVVIENRAGASGAIGASALLGAPADGYTFLIADGAFITINPLMIAKLTYNPGDVLPVAVIAKAPLFLAVNPNVPAKDMKELIAYVKANPGKLNYGSIGTGSFHHLSMEALKAALGLDMNHIPYKGSGEMSGALLGGHIDLMFAAYAGLRAGVETEEDHADGCQQRKAFFDCAGRSVSGGICAGFRSCGDPGHHGAGRHAAGRGAEDRCRKLLRS